MRTPAQLHRRKGARNARQRMLCNLAPSAQAMLRAYIRGMGNANELPLLDQALSDHQLLAGWERVRDNAGGPGVDGITVEQFAATALGDLARLRQRVTAGSYQPLPLRRIEIARRGKSPRILAVPCVPDRVVQSAVALTISPLLDPGFEDFSFGYRPGRSVPRAVQHLIDARDSGLLWVAEADIQSCFDSIPWAPLVQRLADRLPDPALMALVRHWISLPLQWPDGHRQARCMGVPQGSPLSPLLSNVFLDGLDKALASGPWRMVRYADDFVLAADTKENARKGLKHAAQWLRGVGLRLNLEKSRVVHFDQGFDFLGVRFHGRQTSAVQTGAEPWVLPRAAQAPGQAAQRGPSRGGHCRPTCYKQVAPPAPAPVSAPHPQPQPAARPSQPEHELQRQTVATPAQPLAPRLRTLYLTEPGAYLHIDGERFIVGKGSEELASIPAEKVDQVLADTEGAVSFGALRLLLRNDATLLLAPSASDETAGLFTPINGRQVQLRAAQFAKLSDGAFRLAMAKRIVQAKIGNSCTVLRRYRRFRPQTDRGEGAALQKLHAQCAQASTLDAVRGFEGRAARIYFEAFATLLDARWRFDARNRQPPQDPVNALLSYGYTVLFHTVHTFILRRGLDPFVGALHAPRDGHAALASDLMEPYRSLIVDTVVLQFLARDGIGPENFDAERPGRLPQDIKRLYIHALERKLASPVGRDGSTNEPADWRRLIERDVNTWAAATSGRPESYQPWRAR